MKKNLTIARYIKRVEFECRKQNIRVPRVRLKRILKKNRLSCRRIIKKELQDYFTLLDLGISAIAEIH